MAKADFVNQLKARGHEIHEPYPGFVVIDYEIKVGRFFGEKVLLGFTRIDQFPDIPPGGPNFNKHLKPFNTSVNTHPDGGIHYSRSVFPNLGLGAEWQYWSRPCNGWANTDRSIDTYFAHLNHLLDTI